MLYIVFGAGIGALLGVGGLWCALMYASDTSVDF